MKLNRSPLFISSVTTLAFLAGAVIAWWQWGDQWLMRAEQHSRGKTGLTTSTDPSGRASSPVFVASHEINELQNDLRHADFSSPDLTQSSWQDPFQPDLWDATGCRFAGNRLILNHAGQATFLRPYRRIRIEFTASSQAESRLPGEWPVQFEVHLIDPQTDTATVLVVTDQEASVSQRTQDRWAFIRQTPIDLSSETDAADDESDLDATEGTTFRINATGSRFLVSRGNRLLLNCPQPPSNGADLYLRIAARDSELNVSHLRIEGE